MSVLKFVRKDCGIVIIVLLLWFFIGVIVKVGDVGRWIEFLSVRDFFCRVELVRRKVWSDYGGFKDSGDGKLGSKSRERILEG